MVLETATLNASELAEYCRRKGLFVEQIATWRAACMAANARVAQQTRGQQSKEDKKRIRDASSADSAPRWSSWVWRRRLAGRA